MEALGGPLFSVAGAGESHGPGVLTIVNGCPAGLRISRSDIQQYLDRRRPGSNRHGTPRNEKDKVLILSGLFDDNDHDRLLSGPDVETTIGEQHFVSTTYETGLTTGEPIAAMVLSVNNKSRHYEQFSGETGEARPGHTDLVKHHKSSGFVDYRGGGRSSYRSTITDVIGGAIARTYLERTFGTIILSSISQVGSLKASRSLADLFGSQRNIDPSAIDDALETMRAAEIYSMDAEFARKAGELIKQTRINGDSIGAKVEVVALNVPALVGEPLYNSLKVRLMGALGGIHAAQACEIGAGADVVDRLGSQNNDPIRQGGYARNSHGGMIGGMTTGMPIIASVSFKPTSTITHKQASVRKNLEEIEFQLNKGRHDPCVGVRAGVTLESRLAIELLNGVLWHQSGRVDAGNFRIFS